MPAFWFAKAAQAIEIHRCDKSPVTAAIAMRLAVEVRPFGPHPLLGIGVDELRWLAPVRAGDKLHLEGEVVELTPSKTKGQMDAIQGTW